jgi:hypothetical protein
MRYKNISTKEMTIPGIGVVEAGGEIETKQEISNPNFQEVKGKVEEKEDHKVKK